jgi:hypothetical protein
MRKMRKAYGILFAKPEGKRPLGRIMRRWEDNTEMDLREIGWEYVDWTGTSGGSCEHGNEPTGSMKGEEFLG